MDYIKLISDNTKPEELLHDVAGDIKRYHTAIVRALSQDKLAAAAGLLGELEFHIDLLLAVDEKMNGSKKTTVVA